MTSILGHIRVLDFTQVLSGPTATRYLAELGAQVIKVEAPPAGDITRSSVTRRNGRSGYFVTVNRGKQSVCVDLKADEGRDLIQSLVPTVDVVIENFSPGTMGRLGLGWETLAALNPGLIMCSISGFGHHGPLAHLPGYDGAAQAYAGLTSLNGERGGDPVAFGAPVGDVLTGMNGVAGILAALLWRERTGEGQLIETSVLESYLQSHDTAIQSHSVSGGEIKQTRNGRFHPLVCPYGIFEAADGHVFIAAAADRHWVDLCDAMGQPEMATPEHQWHQRVARESDRDEINELIDRWLLGLASRDDAVSLLQQHRVPCGPVLSIDEVVNHPELREAGFIRDVADPALGSITVPGFPLRFSAMPQSCDAVAPDLGQHNEQILLDAAGGPDRFAELLAAGVIYREG
ncbi:MAG: CoA:oxalate CoA-transferase [Acidimicrobiales bacterium]